MIPRQPGVCAGPDCTTKLKGLTMPPVVERPDPDRPGKVIFYCCEFCAEMAA